MGSIGTASASLAPESGSERVRFALAKELARDPKQQARVLTLAREAREGFSARRMATALAEVDEWLAERAH